MAEEPNDRRRKIERVRDIAQHDMMRNSIMQSNSSWGESEIVENVEKKLRERETMRSMWWYVMQVC